MSQVLTVDGARVVIDPAAGGRITSLAIGNAEVMATLGGGVMQYGSFVMVPWAGRIRDGLLRVGGVEHRLPTDLLPPHAGHGLVLDRPWHVQSAGTDQLVIRCDLDSRWPFVGHVLQEFQLTPDRLTQRIQLHAGGTAFPATVGWHPWFRRVLDGGAVAQLVFSAEAMLAKDAAGIPSGEVVAIPPGPWDDCFVRPTWPFTITWPGVLSLRISSDVEFVVVYDEHAEALCVEPQSGPPDGPNFAPMLVRPGEPLVASTVWAWA